MKYYTNRHVAMVLTPELAKRTTRRALELHARNRFQQPLKPYVRWGSDNRKITMPAILFDGDTVQIGTKDIASVPDNIDHGFPRANGLITLFSAKTGRPEVVMECAEVSRRRTAAVASLCLDCLAGEGPWNPTILGSGPVAAAVLASIIASPNIDHIRLYDVRQERSEALARTFADNRVIAAATLPEALANANILITATTGSKGYLTTHIVGKKRLIVALSLEDAAPELLLAADKLVVDSFDDCNREGKPLHILVQSGRLTREMVHGELGQILVGSVSGRTDPNEFIFVNPMGMAIEDIALASAVHELLQAQNIGMTLPTT